MFPNLIHGEGESIQDLPNWHRAAFQEVEYWLFTPPAPRAVLLSGARQIGKTTLLLQAIQELLERCKTWKYTLCNI